MHIVFTIISIIGLLLAIACLALLANTRKLLIGGTDIDQFWPKRRRFIYWTNIFMLIPNAIYLFLTIASYFLADFEPSLLLTFSTMAMDLLIGISIIFTDYFITDEKISFKEFWSGSKTSTKVYSISLILLVILTVVLNLLIHAWGLD